MSPIPERESVKPQMFGDLKGADFIDAFKAIDSLTSGVESAILVPPNQKVVLCDSQIPYSFQKRILTGFSEAILFRGKKLVNRYDYLMDSFVPEWANNLNKAEMLQKLFGIKTSFSKTDNIIGVKREGLPQIQFKQGGSRYPISGEHRHAILALSLVPDELWKNIYHKGLSVGVLFGNDYDIPWKVKSISVNLPMGNNGRLGESPDRLTTLSMESLSKLARAESSSKAFNSLDLVGVFLDLRGRRNI